MKFYIFGSDSGTEPFPGRHHVSFSMQTGDRVYIFDAGENCSYNAHLMGVDLLCIREVFISHTHMDHVGGLGNLLWNVRKLTHVRFEPFREGELRIHIPVLETGEGIMKILRNSEGGYNCDYTTTFLPVKDGVLTDDGTVKVTALHNSHLKPTPEGEWLSYSYKIEFEGKSVVFSGDVGSFEELYPLIGDHCDLVLMETGHHHPVEVCKKAAEKSVDRLYFIHHGRYILDSYDEMKAGMEAALPGKTRILDDMDTFEI